MLKESELQKFVENLEDHVGQAEEKEKSCLMSMF